MDGVDDGPEDPDLADPDTPTLNDRLSTLLPNLIAGDEADPDAIRELYEFLCVAAGHAPTGDRDDAVSKVLLGLMSRLRSDPRPIARPAAYLRTAVRNALRELERRRERIEPVEPDRLEYLGDLLGEPTSGPEDLVEARQLMDLAMSEAIRRGDLKAVKMAMTWLDLDDELGYPPSLRELGAEVELSHTQVGRILQRLALYARDVSRE